MFLDTSAIIEYFLEGPEYDRVAMALANPQARYFVSPTVIFEATSVLAELDAEILPATRETALAAIDAFSRYGRGRHPARLNFGDCFSYASAKASGAPLFYVGEDFRRTDLA